MAMTEAGLVPALTLLTEVCVLPRHAAPLDPATSQPMFLEAIRLTSLVNLRECTQYYRP